MIGTKMILIFEIFSLLIFFQLKHFVADYPLQGKYMLKKFRPDWGFFFPLLTHATVHALFTLAVCLWLAPHLWWLALVDLSVHFVMDRAKAGPKYLGRYKSLTVSEFKRAYDTTQHAKEPGDIKSAKSRLVSNILFWWALGFDQMVHHLTHYYIIFVIVMDKALTC